MDEIFETVETKERTVVEHYVTIAGSKFECLDLYETLSAVRDEDVELCYTKEKIASLKEAGIIENEGCRRWMTGATLGKNGNIFIERLERLIYEED